MKNDQSELTQMLLRTLEELLRDHEQQQQEQRQFFAQQQRQWEQQVADLAGRVQDLRRQLEVLSASLPLTSRIRKPHAQGVSVTCIL